MEDKMSLKHSAANLDSNLNQINDDSMDLETRAGTSSIYQESQSERSIMMEHVSIELLDKDFL